MLSVIVCCDANNGIGYKGELLCKIPEDMKRFKEMTNDHIVIMGRKTRDSIGRPLSDRISYIITNNYYLANGKDYIERYGDFVKELIENYKDSKEEVFVIGGQSIYEQFLPYCKKVYMTRVNKSYLSDTYFPVLPTDEWDLCSTAAFGEYQGTTYQFLTYERKEISIEHQAPVKVMLSENKIIALVGESGSGKSTLEDELTTMGYDKIVTYTTRPMREEDVDGETYHFLTDEEFEELKNKDFFAETAEYNGWMYGSAAKDYTGKKVIVLTPKGLRAIRRKGIDVTSFYINVQRRDRLIKILQRGDNIDEACRRSLSDCGQYDGIEDEVDFVIWNEGYKKSAKSIADEIIRLEGAIMTISIGGFAACVLAAFIVGGVVGLLLACVVMSGRDDNDDWDGVDE